MAVQEDVASEAVGCKAADDTIRQAKQCGGIHGNRTWKDQMLRALSYGHQRQIEGLNALRQPLADPVDDGPQDDGICAERQVRTMLL